MTETDDNITAEAEDGAGMDEALGDIDGPSIPGPDEDVTQKVNLKRIARRMARHRRRNQVVEVSVTRPGGDEVRLQVERDQTFIGRDPRCDIVLDDPQVSRRHACLETQ